MQIVARNAPCPCGSGKKYKKCCSQRPSTGPSLKGQWAIGIGIAAVMILVVAAAMNGRSASQSANITNFLTIDGVNISRLSESARMQLLRIVNRESCNCGCSMTLVQCINTDKSCPLIPRHLTRVKQLKRQLVETPS